MLQNPCKTFAFKKNMVYKIPPGGGGKPYPASGLQVPVRFFVQNVHITSHGPHARKPFVIILQRCTSTVSGHRRTASK